jgi:hypothetical protein
MIPNNMAGPGLVVKVQKEACRQAWPGQPVSCHWQRWLYSMSSPVRFELMPVVFGTLKSLVLARSGW